MPEYAVRAIGFIRSELKTTRGCALVLHAGSAECAGSKSTLLWSTPSIGSSPATRSSCSTWLHLARRDVLKVHPQGDLTRPLTGVFLTRSPDRPNPIGLHRTRVLEKQGATLVIGPMEAIDGTPVLDIKCVVDEANDS